MKPLIAYYGGKQKIAHRIAPILEAIPHRNFVVPFCGGLGVFFAKRKAPIEVINDHDEQLITMYRYARENPEEFKRLMDLTPYSRAEHRRANEILKSDSATPKEMAWAYFVSTQQGFYKKKGDTWMASTNRTSPNIYSSKINHIPDCLERLRSVYIECSDALKIIKLYDSPDTLFYLDPPYPGTEQGHYGGYTMEHFQQLCDTLDDIKGSYVLSNYPQPIEPKSAQSRVKIKATVGAANSNKNGNDKARTEVLWVCDRTETMQIGLFDEGRVWQ